MTSSGRPTSMRLEAIGDTFVLGLPSLRGAARHFLPPLLEGVIAPVAVFYLTLVFTGFTGAIYSAFGWSLAVVARRLVLRQRVPGMVWLSVGLLGARTVIGVLTKSALFYFIQPTLSTVLVALIFLFTATSKRPFIERLAHDFCPFPPELLARVGIRRFFVRISLLWASVMLVNAGVVLALLVTSSVSTFIVERTVITWGLSGVAIAGSVYAFWRALAHEKIHLRIRTARA